MAEQKVKGSILYKFLILVLAVTLVASILYPKVLADREHESLELSQYRMSEIQKAGLQYQKYNSVYTDTLTQIFDFIRTNPEYAHYVDSVVVGGLDSVLTRLQDFNDRQGLILAAIPSAMDTVMIDSLTELQNAIKFDSRALAGYVEYVHDRMKNLPNMPMEPLREAFKFVDSKKFTMDMEIVKNSVASGQLEAASKASADVVGVISSMIASFEEIRDSVPAYKGESLEQLASCPTTSREFRLVHVDTSVVKYLNIYSPINEDDIALVEADFLKSKIGGLSIQNHGKIESGEKSWETEEE